MIKKLDSRSKKFVSVKKVGGIVFHSDKVFMFKVRLPRVESQFFYSLSYVI